MSALNALAIEPAHSSAQEADRGGLLVVRQHFHVVQSGAIVDRNVHTVEADSGRAALLPVTGDAVVDLAKASELVDVDMDPVSGMLPLTALDWRFGLEITQPPETKAVEQLGHGGEGIGQQPGDVPQVEALVAEVLGLLQLLWIERLPLVRRTLRRSASAPAPPER